MLAYLLMVVRAERHLVRISASPAPNRPPMTLPRLWAHGPHLGLAVTAQSVCLDSAALLPRRRKLAAQSRVDVARRVSFD